MQWLIDIITDLFNNRHRYFDRGDPAAWDFMVGDFVQDNLWHDLDLSVVIPSDVVSAHLRVVVETTSVNIAFNLRTKGNTDVFNVTRTTCTVAYVRNSVDVLVTPDSNGVVEYKCFNDTFTRLNICVAGWWLR